MWTFHRLLIPLSSTFSFVQRNFVRFSIGFSRPNHSRKQDLGSEWRTIRFCILKWFADSLLYHFVSFLFFWFSTFRKYVCINLLLNRINANSSQFFSLLFFLSPRSVASVVLLLHHRLLLRFHLFCLKFSNSLSMRVLCSFHLRISTNKVIRVNFSNAWHFTSILLLSFDLF